MDKVKPDRFCIKILCRLLISVNAGAVSRSAGAVSHSAGAVSHRKVIGKTMLVFITRYNRVYFSSDAFAYVFKESQHE